MLSKLALASALIPVALACLGYEGGVPTPTRSYSNSAPIEIAAGQTFDAGWAKYDRGSGACSDGEGGNDDAVFILQSGATLKNVIIGKNQKEGVHCEGPCTLEFVWFEDVCEDAITVRGDKAGDHTWIIGGGAYHASDKIVQHNGCGTVNIINFYAEDYGKVYRSCGNCSSQCKRNVYIEGVTAYDGGEICGINQNYGDTCTLNNVCTDAKTPCQMYSGCAGGCEPSKVGACSG
ncbi:pectate lyase [Aspergillus mulundensis]|uniref:Pectate lyase n=1 Tax=Aspergillus mulundensis TaxID=1810919 RepID=A0A3D8SW62_9EURO|nr:putative pectate lyase F [Aspergillus mulundensis]RDW90535.1 putative pectate lyase F [Aspergillus mulundensis]